LFVQWNRGKKCRHCRIGTGRLGAAHHPETASERFLDDKRKPFALAGQHEDVARLIERRNRSPAQIGEDHYVRQVPIAWVQVTPAGKHPRDIWAKTRHPRQNVKTLLFDEPANEQRDRAIGGQAQASAEFHFLFRLDREEDLGVDPGKHQLWCRTKRNSRKIPGRDLAEECDTVGTGKHRPHHDCIREAHHHTEDRIVVGHDSDMLGYHNRLARQKREQKRSNAHRV
jgi:hypothetical protein